MSSLVKLSPSFKPLNLLPEEREMVSPTSDQMGALIPCRAYLISGPEAGKEITDGIVQMRQIIRLEPIVNIRNKKYTLLVSYNPTLLDKGTVSCPSVLPPGEPVSLTVKANRNFELAEYTDQYCFIVYSLN